MLWSFAMHSTPPGHLSARHEQVLRLGLYALQTIVVALFTWRTIVAPQLSHASVSTWQFVFDGIVIGVLAVGLVLRHSARGLWELIASLWIFPGVWFACLLVFPYEPALVVASLVTLCGLVIRVPACQWVMCAIGVVGIAINLGTSLPPDFLLLALVAWAAYDMLLPPVGLKWIGTLPGTSYELRGRTHEPILMPADIVLPMSVLARAIVMKPLSGWLVGGGMTVALVLVFFLPPSRRQLTVGVLAVGAVVPFTVLRLLGAL